MATAAETGNHFKAKPEKPKSLKDLQERWITYYKDQILSVLSQSINVSTLSGDENDLTDRQNKFIWETLYAAYGEHASDILHRDNEDKSGHKAWSNLMQKFEPSTLRRMIEIMREASKLRVDDDRNKDTVTFKSIEQLGRQVKALALTPTQMQICMLMWAFDHRDYASELRVIQAMGMDVDYADVRDIIEKQMEEFISTTKPSGRSQNTGFLGHPS